MQNEIISNHSNKIIIEQNNNISNSLKNFLPFSYQPTIEDKLASLIDEIKEEYGLEWKEILQKTALPEFEEWEIKELYSFLNTPIKLKKGNIDFNCKITISEIYNELSKSPLYLKGSALDYFLIYYLHKKYRESGHRHSKGSYLMRWLNSIYSEKKQCSLLKMLSPEEIDALAERTAPSDLDFFHMEDFLGDQTDKVIQFVGSKIPTNQWYPSSIKSQFPKNINLPQNCNSLKSLFFEKKGLRNFCKPTALHLISFGNHTKGKFFDLVFYPKNTKQRNTIFIQGGLRIRVDQLFGQQQSSLQPMRPEVAENDPFSASEVFLENLKKDLTPAYEITEQFDFFNAALKMVKGYSFSEKESFQHMLPETTKQFLNKIDEKQWYNYLEKEIHNHLNDEPVKSLFFLYHISWIAEECFDTSNLSQAVQSLLQLWDHTRFQDPWVSKLFKFFKAKIPFKLLHSWMQIIMLYALEQKKEPLFFRFKHQQKSIAAQIPIKLNNQESTYFLLIPLNFEKALDQIKMVFSMPKEAFLLLESLVPPTSKLQEKPTLIRLQSLSIPLLQPIKMVEKSPPLIKILPPKDLDVNKPHKSDSFPQISENSKTLVINSAPLRRKITVDKKNKRLIIESPKINGSHNLSSTEKVITPLTITNKEILDPSSNLTSKRILEIFNVQNCPQFKMIDKKLSKQIKNGLLLPTCDLFYKIGSHPLTKDLSAIDLLIIALFKSGISSNNYHKLILLITTFRLSKEDYWIGLVHILLKTEQNDLLKELLELIHRNTSLKTLFYKQIGLNIWPKILNYFIEKKLKPQMLFCCGFDLSLAAPLLEKEMLSKIQLKHLMYKSSLIQKGDEKNLELIFIDQKKLTLDANNSEELELLMIDKCLHVATETSLNEALNLLLNVKSIVFNNFEMISRLTSRLLELALKILNKNKSALVSFIDSYQKIVGKELSYLLVKKLDAGIELIFFHLKTIDSLETTDNQKNLLYRNWMSILIDIDCEAPLYQEKINKIMIKLINLGIYKNNTPLEAKHLKILSKKPYNTPEEISSNPNSTYSFPINLSFLLIFGKMISSLCSKFFFWKKK